MRYRRSPWTTKRAKRHQPLRVSKDFLQLLVYGASFTFLVVSAWLADSEVSSDPAVAASKAAAYYSNCAAARSAGAAPLYAGNPGYRAKLDRDGDGVACEPYRGY